MAVARRGFTLLEAVVALAIVGVVAVGALAAYGAEMRAAVRAQDALSLEALAEERLAALTLAGAPTLRALPDSLREGRFAAPFTGHHWTAAARAVSGEADLWEMTVTVRSQGGGMLTLRTRRHRPLPRVAEASR